MKKLKTSWSILYVITAESKVTFNKEIVGYNKSLIAAQQIVDMINYPYNVDLAEYSIYSNANYTETNLINIKL